MPLDQHLMVHMQEIYADARNYRNLLNGWSDQLRNQQLRTMIAQQIHEIGDQLDNLRQCLLIMGSAPDEAMLSPVVDALQREDQITHRAIPNMSPADMDVHVAMTDISFGQMEIGAYQGMVDMARELGQQDVATMLQHNLEEEQDDIWQMQQLLPELIRESQVQ
jgi:ferritin-like metal-binding protein YciE